MARAGLAVVGFLLALGTKAPVTGSLFSLAYNNIPAFRVFREPQKFVALITLAYAMLGAAGLDRYLSRRSVTPVATASRNRADSVVPILLIALVCIDSFRMFGGLWGQAKPVSYPRSWSIVQQTLDRDTGDWSALYLPPYWYMRFDFTGSDYTITNPMPLYFTNRSLPRTSIEVGPQELDRQPLDRYVDAALSSGSQRGNLGAMLAPLNVKYVVLARNPASANFKFVEQQKDLEVVRDLGDVVLLRNKAPSYRLVLTRSTGTFTTLASLSSRAHGGVLLGSELFRGTSTFIPESTGVAVPHDAKGSTRLSSPSLPGAQDAGRRALLFGESFSPYWRMNGASPRLNLGVTMAYPVAPGTGSVQIAYRNPWLITGYVLSGAALLLSIILVLGDAIPARDRKKPSRVGGEP